MNEPNGCGNLLLSTLSPQELQSLPPVEIDAELGRTIHDSGEVPADVVFPGTGSMLSLVRTDESGATVEVGVVGANGASPLQHALANQPCGSQGVVQVPGRMVRIGADAVRQLFASHEAFRRAALLHASVYLDQVSQNAICNRLHGLEERLAKWLLVSSRYARTDELSLTHEFLSHMLGVRRSGVTVAVNTLTMDGLIVHARGIIKIVDREGLERRSCECADVLRRGLDAAG